jgi:Helix-turn-helix domain
MLTWGGGRRWAKWHPEVRGERGGAGWRSGGEPTVRRMLLGAHLRKLRDAKGVSREKAGWAIRASESKISRMELGRVGFKERDIADLLTLYGVADADERAALLTLARRTCEVLTSALYLDRREDVDRYAEAVGRLFIEAKPLARTQEILRGAVHEIDAVLDDDRNG